MSRSPREVPGGCVYHVLNRAVARLPRFKKPADYAAFVRVLAEALDECPIRIPSFLLMPNHWHFVLWPENDSQLTDFCRWLAHTHSVRWARTLSYLWHRRDLPGSDSWQKQMAARLGLGHTLLPGRSRQNALPSEQPARLQETRCVP